MQRSYFFINLDPAAEDFAFEPNLDIKQLIRLDDVMDDNGLGPNGGLIYCFEYASWSTTCIPTWPTCARYLLENLEFISDAVHPLSEEFLIIVDMPGQIELYTHIPIIPTLIKYMARTGSLNVRLCVAYLLESTFIVDRKKYFAGALSAMSAMMTLDLPHINILSKADIVGHSLSKKELEKFSNPNTSLLDDEVDYSEIMSRSIEQILPTAPHSGFIMDGESSERLNRALARLIEDFNMVSFLNLNVQNEDSVGAILSYIDDAVQFIDAQEPRNIVGEVDTAE